MLFLHWVGNRFLSLVTNVLYNTTLSDMETCYKLFDRARARRHHDARRPLRLRARDHRQGAAARASGSTRCRSPTPGASSTRARRSPGATASRRSGRLVKYRFARLTATWPRWAAVVVNYESGPLLAECVRSLRPTERRAEPRSSSSTTGRPTARSPRCAAALPDGRRRRRRRRNLGYAAAANRGVAATTRAGRRRRATPTSTVAPGTAAAMLRRLDAEPDLAAVGPRMRQPRRHARTRRPAPFPSTGRRGRARRARPRVRPRTGSPAATASSTSDPGRPRDVDWVSGACAVAPADAPSTSVGGWDERYFMYMEDVDLCWRLRRVGWRVAYEPAGERRPRAGRRAPAAHPYRMIVEHHRSAYRFAASGGGSGVRRLLLVPAACFLAVRARCSTWRRRALRTRPEVPRVTG